MLETQDRRGDWPGYIKYDNPAIKNLIEKANKELCDTIYFLLFNRRLTINEEKSILHFLFMCLLKSPYCNSDSDIDSNNNNNISNNTNKVTPYNDENNKENHSCYSSPRSGYGGIKSEIVNAHQISILIIDILGLTMYKRNEIEGSYGIFSKYPFHNKVDFQSFYSWYWSSKIAEIISPSRIKMKFRKLKGYHFDHDFVMYNLYFLLC